MAGMMQVPFGTTRVTRPRPAMDPRRYTTYQMSMPLRTHWRPATCEEVDCGPCLHGWVTTVDLSTDLGQKQYEFITHDRERRPSMQRASMTLVKFTYAPGFPCFNRSKHRLPLERPAKFIVAHGDFRRYLGPPRVHVSADDWTEDFSIHQDKLRTALERG